MFDQRLLELAERYHVALFVVAFGITSVTTMLICFFLRSMGEILQGYYELRRRAAESKSQFLVSLERLKLETEIADLRFSAAKNKR